jgi:hypothetical protein
MPRYRLLTAHYTEEDKWLPGDQENSNSNAPITGYVTDEDGNQVSDEHGQPIPYRGTLVGDRTPHKWTRDPTPEMEGLDEESKALVAKAKLRGDGLNPVDYLPMTGPSEKLTRRQLEEQAKAMGLELAEAE